jgi:hypothetical protein
MLPSRREVEVVLRQCGLSHRQAKRFISAGWPVLVGETEAEAEELREKIEALEHLLKGSVSPDNSHVPDVSRRTPGA